MKLFDLFSYGIPFFSFSPIYDVVVIIADHRTIGRNDGNVKLVNVPEFGCFGFRCTGHPGQLGVQPEVVLQRDRRQGLVLRLYFNPLFGFHGLMQPVAPAASRHYAAGELVYYDYLALLNYVLLVKMVERVSLQRLLDTVEHLYVVGVVKIADRKYPLGRLDTLLSQRGGMLFLVNVIDQPCVLLEIDVAIGAFDLRNSLLLLGL